MSMGSPQMISGHTLSRREVRNERRWQDWREHTGMASYLIKQGRYDAACIDKGDKRHRKARRKALRQVHAGQWRLLGLYALLPLVGAATGLSYLFARPIDAWDRWMTTDPNRN